MIVLSLVLILVAVALLALGLTGGSSTLLIASIVASLLAAIVLVIGARRAAALRQAAEQERHDAAPPLREYAGAPPRREAATARFAPRHRSVDSVDEQVTVEGAAVPGAEHAEASAYAAGRRDAEQALNDHGGVAAGGGDAPAATFADQAAFADQAGVADQAGFVTTGSPDSSGLSGEFGSVASAGSGSASADDLGPGSSQQSGSGSSEGSASGSSGEFGSGSPEDFGSGSAREFGSGGAAEFGEPDPEDPEDEPLPEAVSAADAVRIAGMEAEVLVVDSRPRYHLGDCPDLADRVTEPLPVAEAVELGFTPCGLCRPVAHLVTAAVRR